MNRRQFVLLTTFFSGISAVNNAAAQFNLGKALDAGKTLVESETLNDDDLRRYFDQMAADSDRRNRVAGSGDPYGQRLAKLTSGLEKHDGLALNYKVYLTPEINAFAMANGTIRVYSGLMDKFTDDEIRYVIGHEIGHVKSGHTKARIQTAMRTSALKSAASSAGGKTAALAESQLGELFSQVITAQHSQANERQADDYALGFMKKKKYPAVACVDALEKLDALGGGSASWLSTHPSPKERAKRLKAMV
ncbi:MAG: M48 family metallopeptidase [Azonexus sp.]|jgi:putative metalloprotease|uniref:M48 family metallopeptidase n=1 Tax=Azonexus sp. TaxID=1872668 RepID=UPI00282317C8|nr:M48 family metallopeptidase [Azonexus sp.]MDR0775604.1 M48 family metallopeptidase [Azonexus sp.]